MTYGSDELKGYDHFNSPDKLPPVGCKLVLVDEGGFFYAVRTGYIESKDREMEYIIEDGTLILGRYWWTYP